MVGRYYGNDPSSDDHLAAILEWLSSCLLHPQCKTTASGTAQFDARDVPLPTRCIDIRQDHVSLQDTSALRGSYVTLSHRWEKTTGDTQTTTSNLDIRAIGLDIDNLPQMFKDAVSITRNLGIRYLWIDSLCILQSGDNGADFLKEASHMARYYQQALLTISAPSMLPSGGFLAPRPDVAFRSLVRIPYRNRKNIREGHFYIYRPTRQSSQLYTDKVLQSESSSRGWIFQEWLLSRRIIYFTPREIFFKCQAEAPRSERQQTITVPRERDLTLRRRSKSSIFDPWYTLVENYSRTGLTRPEKDRIVALSGIAQEFREVIKAHIQTSKQFSLKYLSGLWLEDLHYGLLWQSTHKSHRVSNCGAPSWSWAAQLREVRWLQRATKSVNELTILTVVDNTGVCFVSEPDDSSKLNRHTSPGTVNYVNNQASDLEVSDLMSAGGFLIVKGHTQILLIDSDRGRPGYRPELDRGTVETLARSTFVELPKDYELWKDDKNCQRAGDWCFVCSLSTPNVVGGWALFDDLRLISRSSKQSSFTALALHVSTRKQVASSVNSRLTNLRMNHEVYDVLFLEEEGGETFRRIGVGRIMDRQIMKAFNDADAQELTLI